MIIHWINKSLQLKNYNTKLNENIESQKKLGTIIKIDKIDIIIRIMQ